MSTRLLTTTETARKLGKSARTVARLAESGELPHVHKLPGIRGAYLFDPAIVDLFARQQAARAVAS